MAQKRWLILLVFMWLFTFSCGRELKVKHQHHPHVYNHTLATILVEYASAVYMSDLTELFTWTCSRCDGLTKGFEIIELIVDVQHCLQAFVGVAKDLDAVVIAFRGTQEHSIQNWIEDLFWKQLDLNYPGMSDAMVHHGFYSAYHNTTIRPGILNAVERAKDIYGDLKIVVTGHSMGGAMAAFCGLDLTVNLGAQDVQVMTFGQPRIGNAAFASYYIQLVPNTIRVTNEHDIVPHLPPYYSYFPQKTYHHFPREVWLYNVGLGSLVYKVEKICDSSGEDPTCSRSVTGNSVSDHLFYFGVKLGCDAWRSCGIVMDPRVAEYGKTDLQGNFVLSRIPATPILKLKTESDAADKRM
ncbi:Lipase [Melia azedarach]|uniref:Lipase n=1 Tax=Melia azedarach TaxID=155640 RepID=A0ACC1YGU6_MELAZ|nr:Lipase [Melia azedarach]